METNNQVSKGRLWASYILQGIVLLMFFWGGSQQYPANRTICQWRISFGLS